MNILTLRKQIAEELRHVCKDFRLKKPLSSEADHWIESRLSVFEQSEPPARMNTEFSHHPFIVVKAVGGGVSSEDLEIGNILLDIETWDDDETLQGEDDVLAIVERIKNHFLAYPILNSTFYCQRDMSYDLNLYGNQPKPHWYATITMTWEIPKTNIMQGAEYV